MCCLLLLTQTGAKVKDTTASSRRFQCSKLWGDASPPQRWQQQMADRCAFLHGVLWKHQRAGRGLLPAASPAPHYHSCGSHPLLCNSETHLHKSAQDSGQAAHSAITMHDDEGRLLDQRCLHTLQHMAWHGCHATHATSLSQNEELLCAC